MKSMFESCSICSHSVVEVMFPCAFHFPIQPLNHISFDWILLLVFTHNATAIAYIRPNAICTTFDSDHFNSPASRCEQSDQCIRARSLIYTAATTATTIMIATVSTKQTIMRISQNGRRRRRRRRRLCNVRSSSEKLENVL